jgi:hypothetical protein
VVDHLIRRPHPQELASIQARLLEAGDSELVREEVALDAARRLQKCEQRDVGQRPGRALQPACFEPVGDDLMQLLAL